MSDTTELQARINAEPVVVLEPGRTYDIDGAVGLKVPSDRTIVMDGATLRLIPGTTAKCRMFETVPGAVRVRFLGGSLVGDMSPTSQFRIGLRIDSATDVVVERTTFSQWKWDGIWIGGNAPSVSVRLSGVLVDTFGRNGLSIVNAQGVTVERCSFRSAVLGSNPGAGIDVEPNAGEQVADLQVIGCDSYGNEVGFYLHPGHGQPGADYLIAGNVASGNRKYGLIINSLQTGCVYGNLVTDSPKGYSVGSSTEANRARCVVFSENVSERCQQGLILAGVADSDVVGNKVGLISMPALGISGDVAFKRNQ